MWGFCTPINQLWMINSHLAKEFASVNQELEVILRGYGVVQVRCGGVYEHMKVRSGTSPLC